MTTITPTLVKNLKIGDMVLSIGPTASLCAIIKSMDVREEDGYVNISLSYRADCVYITAFHPDEALPVLTSFFVLGDGKVITQADFLTVEQGTKPFEV